MGKKLIIPGADFSENAILFPLTIVVSAGKQITINGTTYPAVVSDHDEQFNINVSSISALGGGSANTALKSIKVNCGFAGYNFVGYQTACANVEFGPNAYITDNSLRSAFRYTALTELDLSNLNLSNVTHIGSMCYANASLTKIKLDGCDLSGVSTISYAFYSCPNLTQISMVGCNAASKTLVLNELNGATGPGGTWQDIDGVLTKS